MSEDGWVALPRDDLYGTDVVVWPPTEEERSHYIDNGRCGRVCSSPVLWSGKYGPKEKHYHVDDYHNGGRLSGSGSYHPLSHLIPFRCEMTSGTSTRSGAI